MSYEINAHIKELYQEFQLTLKENPNSAEVLRQLNIFLKQLDKTNPKWLSEKSNFSEQIKMDVQLLGSSLRYTPETSPITYLEPKEKKTCTLPLTILFSEGPIARAYLATLKSLGYVPDKIIHLVANHDVVSKKPVGRWLPHSIRSSYARSLQYTKMHYWPNKIAKEHSGLYQALTQVVERDYYFPQSTLSNAQQPLPLNTYSDNIETVLVNGLRDPLLYDYMRKLPETLLLFTGGGIVPKDLINISQLRFLHIHPGYLPTIRGADGLLWSVLLAGRPSATGFYLSTGIDTGEIILPMWLPESRIAYNPETDSKILYRALYSFFDPWIRSFVLRQILQNFPNLKDMPTTVQRETDGLTYHFMHPLLLQLSLKHLFHPI